MSRRDVSRAFVGFESNKYEVATALAKQFPDEPSANLLEEKIRSAHISIDRAWERQNF
jgi:hypothetical protein